MKKLNITNLVPDDIYMSYEEATCPWLDIIYDDGCLISTYAAHTCLKELATSWNDDHGQNREYILSTLDLTIKHLVTWRKAFSTVVTTEDMLDSARALLTLSLSSRDLAVQAQQVTDVAKVRAGSGLSEETIRALVLSAFVAPDPEQA